MFRKLLFLFAVFLLTANLLYAFTDEDEKSERKIISGHILDAQTGESLIGASVMIKELGVGTISNSYGFYSLAVAPGAYTLLCSYIGYDDYSQPVELTEDFRIEIELAPGSEELDEIQVRGERKNQNITQVEMGVEKLQTKTIKSIPALMGEVDVIKAIQLLPGVHSTAEGGSGFSVRGGSPDQNLILLDEATVYNASHLMGFFSVFNNDAIKDLKLYKGDVPAQYGGRLSSLLDVRMKDGNSKEFTGAGGIGTISSRLTLEGPLKKDKTTMLLSGRRTYMDLFLPLSSDENVRDSRLYFYDASLKLTHRFNDNNRLYISSYLGRDVMKSPYFRMGFGNRTFTARWNHIFSQKLFMNLTTVWSRYDYELGTAEDEPDSFLWESDLEDIGVKADFGLYITPEHVLKFGAQSFYHTFNPGAAKGTGEQSIFNEYIVDKNYALEHAAYLSHQHKIGNKLVLKYGLRVSLFQSIGEGTVYDYDENYQVVDSTLYASGDVYQNYWGLEPRLGVNYMIAPNWSLKFNYNRSRQTIQQATNTTAGSPLDIWFPASPNVKPQVADQLALGVFHNFQNDRYQLSVEGYYKDMQHTIDFADHADLLLNKYLEGELRVGDSKAYGLEFLLKKTEGDLTGWVGYTLSRAERTIPGINDGKTYVAPFDKTHDISTVLNYQLSERVSLSANWVYSTGQPVTLPIQRYEVNGTVIPYYSERNGSRYDDYHRLDLSLALKSRNRKSRPWSGEWVFSIYNAYNRKNTWAMSFIQDSEKPTETYAEKTYLFPIIPAVTYNFKF
ncbi:TonB-dependent receptor [Sunxiuqinia elliptica]|uniref:Outer membrane receptor for ferrienterochelin and colicin n=1 Tax=Sunxiuqinia elliptica TaxID=655355 RepID=A0A4R6H3Z0_9BACT|nr:TonB-dependent receptor [Sunxiuqinia elliptica]TDO02810.1 outer membrane receptor for ferrienterochelin and colicin [Sunxiuqinia elliptica]TDO58451.1 outer membrane receptor for ferrienterochelin and colicin [Sunxiuqinia elliptica]